MKFKKHAFWLTVLMTFFVFPFLSYGNWQNNSTNEEIDYDIPTQKVVKNNTAGKYYGSIESALEDAKKFVTRGNGHQDLYVLPGVYTTIRKDATISENITLNMPCAGQDNGGNDASGFDMGGVQHFEQTSLGDDTIKNVRKNRKTCVTLEENVTLTLDKGALYLASEWGMKGVRSNYSEIRLSKNSQIKLINGSVMQSYGYIKEVKDNKVDDIDKKRGIYVENSSFYAPISFHNTYSNGTIIRVLYDNNVCPMNNYDFSTIQTHIEFDGRSNFISKCSVCVDSGLGLKYTDKNVIILNSDISNPQNASLFKFTESNRRKFKLVLEYHNDKETTSLSPDKNVYTECKISGVASLGFLKIDNVNYVNDTITIDTSRFYLPVSHRFHITLMENTLFDLYHSVKLLPGSVFKINPGATLSVTQSLIAYKASDSTILTTDGIGYEDTGEDACIINNGTIQLKTTGHIGGKIITENKGSTKAVLDFKNGNDHNLFSEILEGRYKTRICHQAEGVASKNGQENICHFENKEITSVDYNKDKYAILDNAKPCWNKNEVLETYPLHITKENVPEIKVAAFTYSITFTYPAGNFDPLRNCKAEDATYYVDKRPQVTIFFKSNSTGKKQFDSQYASSAYYSSITKEEQVFVKPAIGKYVSVLNRGNNSPSGRGSVVTTLYESPINDPSHFYVIKIFSDEIENFIIPKDYMIKLDTSHRYWNFTEQAYKFDTENYEHAGFNDNYVLQVTTNLTIYRSGKTQYLK